MPSGSYLRPPIEEAICDFTFAFGDAHEPKTIDFTLPGKLQSHELLKEEYTGEVRSQNVQSIVANANQPAVSLQNSLFRIQLTTPDAKRIVSVGPVNLSISVLKPYEGWTRFQPRIERVLAAYFDIARPVSLVRLGIRYINRIVVPKSNAIAAEYLTSPDTHHAEFGGSLVGFMNRSEYVLAQFERIIITQATLQPVDVGTTEFLLDIDVVWDSQPLQNVTEIIGMAQRLHKVEGEIFERLITDNSRALFDAD